MELTHLCWKKKSLKISVLKFITLFTFYLKIHLKHAVEVWFGNYTDKKPVNDTGFIPHTSRVVF